MKVCQHKGMVVLILDGNKEGFSRGRIEEAFGFHPEVALELGRNLQMAGEILLKGKKHES